MSSLLKGCFTSVCGFLNYKNPTVAAVTLHRRQGCGDGEVVDG